MDRLTLRTDPVGAGESFAYDGPGNLTRHADRKGQVATFSYDVLNRRIGGSYADATTSFVFDGGGRLVQATDSVGSTVMLVPVVGGLAGGGFVIGALAGQGANIGLPTAAGSIAGTIAGGIASILGPPVSLAEGSGGSSSEGHGSDVSRAFRYRSFA